RGGGRGRRGFRPSVQPGDRGHSGSRFGARGTREPVHLRDERDGDSDSLAGSHLHSFGGTGQWHGRQHGGEPYRDATPPERGRIGVAPGRGSGPGRPTGQWLRRTGTDQIGTPAPTGE